MPCLFQAPNSQTKPNQLRKYNLQKCTCDNKKKPRLPAPKAPAVLPLTALPALQVVESGVTSATVPAGHAGQTLALPGHGVTAALLFHRPVGVAVTGYSRKTQTAKDAHHPRGTLKCKRHSLSTRAVRHSSHRSPVTGRRCAVNVKHTLNLEEAVWRKKTYISTIFYWLLAEMITRSIWQIKYNVKINLTCFSLLYCIY